MRRRKILKNKKGFTLVEAIAVVAIMGILATVIGGLVTSGTTAYMRQKENSAAKDLGTIVQNEIKQMIYNATEVYLQGEKTASNAKPDDSLVSDTNYIVDDEDDNDGTHHTMVNAPKANNKYSVFKSDGGKLVYTADHKTEKAEYFTDKSRPAEARAFYGSFTIDVYFKALVNSFNDVIAVKVYCDVKNKKGQVKFKSPGLEVDFIEAGVTTPDNKPKFKGVCSYKMGDKYAIKPSEQNSNEFEYKNMLIPSDGNEAAREKTFTTIYFVSQGA